MTYNCVQKIRGKYNNITHYILIDANGNSVKLDRIEVKSMLEKDSKSILNLKLLNNNRIASNKSVDELELTELDIFISEIETYLYNKMKRLSKKYNLRIDKKINGYNGYIRIALKDKNKYGLLLNIHFKSQNNRYIANIDYALKKELVALPIYTNSNIQYLGEINKQGLSKIKKLLSSILSDIINYL